MELSFETEVNASPSTIWAYYTDTKKRALWEEDLEHLSFDGPIATGATGKMKLNGMPEMVFTLIDIRDNQAYWDETEVPGMGSLIFGHDILEKNGSLYIRHCVRLAKANAGKDHLQFLLNVFADVPNAVLKIKSEVEK